MDRIERSLKKLIMSLLSYTDFWVKYFGNEINIQNINAWQSSLLLDGLGRTRMVFIACKGSILGLGTLSLLRHNKAHSLEVSKKEVTSVSDNHIYS
jgi:hypothetical protein